jgi:nicotinamide riboside transporter PnuC
MWQTLSQYYCIDWIALVLNAAAIYRLGKKRKSGFALGVVANLAWIIFGVLAHSVATVMACSIFVALNVKGWLNWSAEPTPKPVTHGATSVAASAVADGQAGRDVGRL